MVSYASHFISTIVVESLINKILSLRFSIVNNVIVALGCERICQTSRVYCRPMGCVLMWSFS